MCDVYFQLHDANHLRLTPGYVEKEVDGGGDGDDAVRVDHIQHGEGSRQLVGQEGQIQLCRNRTMEFLPTCFSLPQLHVSFPEELTSNSNKF